MIQVTFNPPSTEAWKRWVNAAAKEHERLHKLVIRKRKRAFKASLYTKGRTEIFAAFKGKCAYCECDAKLSQSIAVEHYRPKGKVTDIDNRPIRHPGYYWLAYDWSNLLPTCNNCNTLRRHPLDSAKYIGKGMRFPVARRHVSRPNQRLQTEGALLLHPLLDDPSKHLRLDALGRLSPKTPRGAATIDVLGLNREGLPDARRRTRVAIATYLLQFASPKLRPTGQQRVDQLYMIAEALSGKAPFSFAAHMAAKPYKELLKRLPLPIIK